MDEKIQTVKSKVKGFVVKAKEEAASTAAKAGDWAIRNKEMLVISAPVVIAVVKTGQSVLVNHRVKSERKRIDHTYYDPSSGFHWELKRKPTNAERAEILRRKKSGEDLFDILMKMRLLK